jgi:hypothetical protein
MKYELTQRRTRATSNDKSKWLKCDDCKEIVTMVHHTVCGKKVCSKCL